MINENFDYQVLQEMFWFTERKVYYFFEVNTKSYKRQGRSMNEAAIAFYHLKVE